MPIKTQVLDHPQKTIINFIGKDILEYNPFEINTINFNDDTPDTLKDQEYWSNRPIVYIINNAEEAYVGETNSAYTRASQHLKNPDRRRLNLISVLWDNKFNASVVQDLESFLIKHMSADGLLTLQNYNWWMQDYNYPDKEKFQKCFEEIWKWLQSIWLAKRSIQQIENSDDFKFSPYKALTDDQYNIIIEIINTFADDIANNEDSTFIVEWWAWTWKTIIWIYLLKLLKWAIWDQVFFKDEDIIKDLDENINLKWAENLKIWYVTSISNLWGTIDKLFRWQKKREKLVFNPNEVADYKWTFDLLIVDEAHRLRYRKALANYPWFDNRCKKLWLDPNFASELDWIMKKSKHQVLFYDPIQKIRPADIKPEVFKLLKEKESTHTRKLTAQIRISRWWEKYMKYISDLFSNNSPENKRIFSNYQFKLYKDVDKMVNDIKELDKKYWLCRNVAWYSRFWETNPKNKNKTKDYDIDIHWKHYIWNSTRVGWINSANAINEIWCIHTVQWFDLNYCWVIIWEDLKYEDWKWLYADKSNYYDSLWKATTNWEELLELILHIYWVLCTRWIRWTFIYACDPWVRKYLSKYIDIVE